MVIGYVAPVKTASPTPMLFDDRQIPVFKKLADTLHGYDCKVALQIFHPEYDVPGVGRMIMASMMAMKEAEALKAQGDMAAFGAKMQEVGKLRNDAYAKLHHDMKHYVSEATLEQLGAIKTAIAECVRRAMEAGIDAIEVHGDRLLGSLCSTILNHRTDEYGGAFENRIRYALEVVAAIKEAAPTLMIEYKLPIITINADGSLRGKGGLLEEEGIAFAKKLEEAGVDMIQVAQANHTGNMGDTIPSMGTMPYNWTLPVAKKVKEVVNIPIATVGRVVTVANGEEILANGEADMIAYGRSLLCDADIALKVEKDEPIRECLNCNKGCVDAIQGRRYISCVLNAENGDEETIFIKFAEEKKNVVVIGAGIAGLEAARVAAFRGHHVDLYEKEDRIGGQIHIAAAPPRKDEILRSVEYYEQILPAMDVTLHLNTEATKEIMNAADAVIVAVGAHDITLPIEGADAPTVVSSWDVLAAKAQINGHCAVIGGGSVGCELADYLAPQLNDRFIRNREIILLEMAKEIMIAESGAGRSYLVLRMMDKGIDIECNAKVTEVTEDTITYEQNGAIHKITDADTLVFANGYHVEDEMEEMLKAAGVAYHLVGDGAKVGSIKEAISGAYELAKTL